MSHALERVQFTGFSVLSPHIVYGPAHHDMAGRMKELERYAARLQQIFPPEAIQRLTACVPPQDCV
jgi:hypothetical protein